MSDSKPIRVGRTGEAALRDELVRAGIPEIKLALGEVIDRENEHPLPPRYARLLPVQLLTVQLRGDAASALAPIFADLERELTDSCNRHGSLYDRRYTVQLRSTNDPEAPLYRILAAAGEEPSRTEPPAAPPGARAEPISATGSGAPAGWHPGAWMLLVESQSGEDGEVFRLDEPVLTIGRRSDDRALAASIMISDAPQVSRRQLLLRWAERDGAPGFELYNIGLNPVALPGLELPGARLGPGEIDPDRIGGEHRGWVPPGVPFQIGDSGPILRIEAFTPEGPDLWIDPDATVFE